VLRLIRVHVTQVVPPEDANPGFGRFLLTQSNHLNVCKPLDKDDVIYSQLISFVNALINQPSAAGVAAVQLQQQQQQQSQSQRQVSSAAIVAPAAVSEGVVKESIASLSSSLNAHERLVVPSAPPVPPAGSAAATGVSLPPAPLPSSARVGAPGGKS
jgi:hypothetical protein